MIIELKAVIILLTLAVDAVDRIESLEDHFTFSFDGANETG
jgi:hypothetical protein